MSETRAAETIFSVDNASLKFGNGAVEELGWELERLGLKRPLLVADPRLKAFGLIERVLAIRARPGIEADL